MGGNYLNRTLPIRFQSVEPLTPLIGGLRQCLEVMRHDCLAIASIKAKRLVGVN